MGGKPSRRTAENSISGAHYLLANNWTLGQVQKPFSVSILDSIAGQFWCQRI
jgi:hypothetical protein